MFQSDRQIFGRKDQQTGIWNYTDAGAIQRFALGAALPPYFEKKGGIFLLFSCLF